jgi:hypothetical protein
MANKATFYLLLECALESALYIKFLKPRNESVNSSVSQSVSQSVAKLYLKAGSG